MEYRNKIMIDDKELEKVTVDFCKFDTTNPPGNEKKLALFIKDYLEKNGIEAWYKEVQRNRANVYSILTKKEGEEYLLFTGHLDVVPAGSDWETDPFDPVTEKGKIYARGSSDMKSGLASLLMAYIDLCHDAEFKGNLIFLGTCDEEVGCSGVKNFLEHLQLPVAGAIIGEPTSNRLATGEKGALWLKLTFKGKSAHGSQPELGKNAIIDLFKTYNKIFEELSRVPGLTVSLNKISGGAKENTVPDRAECVLDIRFKQNIFSKELKKRISKIMSYVKGSGIEVLLQRESFSSSGILTDSVKTVLNKNGIDPEEIFMNYFTDGAFISQKNIETVIIGPGKASLAHVSNEYVEIDELNLSKKIYEEIARNFFERNV